MNALQRPSLGYIDLDGAVVVVCSPSCPYCSGKGTVKELQDHGETATVINYECAACLSQALLSLTRTEIDTWLEIKEHPTRYIAVESVADNKFGLTTPELLTLMRVGRKLPECSMIERSVIKDQMQRSLAIVAANLGREMLDSFFREVISTGIDVEAAMDVLTVTTKNLFASFSSPAVSCETMDVGGWIDENGHLHILASPSCPDCHGLGASSILSGLNSRLVLECERCVERAIERLSPDKLVRWNHVDVKLHSACNGAIK